MATINRDEIDAFLTGRTSDARLTHLENQGRGQTRVGHKRRRLNVDTMELINTFLSEKKEWCTLLDICEHIDRRPSPNIRKIMTDLIEAGRIEVTHDFGAGPSVPRFWYRTKK